MNVNLNNIYLVGLPGSGKTTLGRLLAQKLEKEFLDSDQYLIEKTGVSIATIFDLEGEEGFRRRESNAISELVQKENIVLATGGGSILNPVNRLILKDRGFVVYLRANPELIFSRTERDNSRPLLQTEKLLEKIKELYSQRDSLYQETAHIIFNVKTASLYDSVESIIHEIGKFKS